MKKSILAASCGLAGVAGFILASPMFADRLADSSAGGRPLQAAMTGGAEAPGPGDPDGTGVAEITLNHGLGEVSFELRVANITTATAAHIHRGAVGVPGPVVVGLAPPDAAGVSRGSATASPDLIKEILQNPEAFYVNVHNADFPGGAVRGQLSK